MMIQQSFINGKFNCKLLGPVVQSIISLTSLLRGQLVKCFMTLLPNRQIFFVEKMREAFAFLQCKSFSYFFNKNLGVF